MLDEKLGTSLFVLAGLVLGFALGFVSMIRRISESEEK